MTPEQFESVRANIESSCLKLLVEKGADYTDGKDRLHNFKTISNDLGVSPLVAWFVYAYKHWKSIANYVRTGQSQSEDIRGRFMDLRNYLDLGLAIVTELECTQVDPSCGSPFDLVKPLVVERVETEKCKSGFCIKKPPQIGGAYTTGASLPRPWLDTAPSESEPIEYDDSETFELGGSA